MATQKAAPGPFPKAGQLGITAVSTQRLWNAGLPQPVGFGAASAVFPASAAAQTRYRVVLQPKQFG